MFIFDILLKFPQILVAVLVTVVVIVAYVIAAAQLLCVNIESYIMLAAGAIFLALGSSRWTNEYVTKYFSYAVTVGLRLLVLLLIIGLTTGFVNNLANGTEKFVFDFAPLFRILVIAMVTGLLAVKAPDMASALLQGGVGFSAGGAKSAASSASSVAAAPFSVASATVGAMTSGGKGVYHGFKAHANAVKLAEESGMSKSEAKSFARKTVAKTLAKEVGRNIVNKALGKKASDNFSVSRSLDKDDKKERQANGGLGDRSKGQGLAKNPGAIDRTNREIKAKLELMKEKKGGSIEAKGGDAKKDAAKDNKNIDDKKNASEDKKPSVGSGDNNKKSSTSSTSTTSTSSSSRSSTSSTDKSDAGSSKSSTSETSKSSTSTSTSSGGQ
jgi:type IV secretion system protein TrbL